jgi:Pectate lyase superfamily protein/Right handed beta helix region/Putative Ig domain
MAILVEGAQIKNSATTIAALKAIATSAKVVNLTAKGVEGVFVWDAANTETPDDGIFIRSNSSATGNWVRQYSGKINAKWYGAVGDGVTDDWAALQKAIDALSARLVAGIYSGGNAFPNLTNAQSPECVIHIPSGVYCLSKTLNVAGGLRLLGDSQAYYTERWLGYASASNTIQGTILQGVEPFVGTCLVDLLPDNAHLSGLTIVGSFLNRGSVQGMTIVGSANGSNFGQKNGTLANNRILVSDPLDGRQYKCSVETTSLPPLTPNFAYEEFLEGWAGQYTGSAPSLVWSIVAGSLPPGLSLTSAGKISGTFAPVNAASYEDATFTVQLTAGSNSSTAVLTIGILTAYCEDKKLLTGTVGRSYNYQLNLKATAAGGQTIAVVGAPSGMTISGSGLISYTPAAGDVGSYELTINVTDTASGKVRSRSLGLEVVAQSSSIRIENINATASGWTAGTARTHQIWAYGGNGTLTWSIDTTQTLSGYANDFPGYPKQNANGTWSPCPGLSLDPATGILSGTPTSSGRATFYPKVTDSSSPTPSYWTEPCILEVGSSSNSPQILTRGFPSARKGQPYSHQLNIQNAVAGMAFTLLPLPSGLSVSTTGLISGTPTGASFIDGVKLHWSASIDNCNIRGFVNGVGVKAHGPTNLHRVSRSMIHRCDIGISLKQCYDSHWEELYVFTNRIGIELKSGAAAHNFINCRIEYIYEAGVSGSYANENAFTSCYWDTCGTQAIVADGCSNLNLTGNRFFRSGRLVFGTGQPDDPKADPKLSSHIYTTKCSDLVLSGNSFHVGSESEGDSTVLKTFSHYDDFARPRHCLNVYACAGLQVVGNSLLGSVNASLVYGDGLLPSDKAPLISNNQVVVRHILERRSPKQIAGNLLANGSYTPGVTTTWTINTAAITSFVDSWTYESGAYQSPMTLTIRKNSDRSLPFAQYLQIIKAADASPVDPNYQLGVLKNSSANTFTWLAIGETLLCSFYARARTDGGSLLPSITVYPATDENSYGADTVFSGRIYPTTAWARYTISLQIPAYTGLTVGKNGAPALELKFLLDKSMEAYDLDLAGHQLEIQSGVGIASPLKLTQLGAATSPQGGGAVASVNGLTGVVVLAASDVGAASISQGAKADTALQPAAIGNTVAAFSDSRLSDQRTPIDSSVTNAKVALNAAIAWSKISKSGASPSDIGAATAAQGTKADSALQPAEIGVSVASFSDTRLSDQRVPIDGSVTDAKIGNRTATDIAPTNLGPGNLSQWLGWITNRIRTITGKANWWTDPATTLEAAATHAANTSNPHSTTAAQIGALTAVDWASPGAIGATTPNAVAATTVTASGLQRCTNTTVSTSTTTGAMVVSGGVGIGGAVNVGGLSTLNTMRVGTSGSTLSRIFTATSTSFNNVAVGANASTTTTLAITGITTSDIVCVAKVSAANPNFDVDGFASASGTVTVTLYNRAATSQTFSGSVRVIVFG